MVLAAILLDCIVGDPPVLPHPVRWFGRYITVAEPLLRKCFPPSPDGERCAGGIVAASLMLSAYAATNILIDRLRASMPNIAPFGETLLAASTLAAKDLFDHVEPIARALEHEDIASAREALAHIVGRDTQDLDAHEIAAAAIESLAESYCDGIVAPLIYLAFGGIPWAMLYKACNTLDSMIGHREAPYTTFGTFAARADDMLNFLPARLAALGILGGAASIGMRPRVNFRLLFADAKQHTSPNAGFPEAAIAQVLGIRLGGMVRYDGVATERAFIFATGKKPLASDLRRAMRIIIAGTIVFGSACVVSTRAR